MSEGGGVCCLYTRAHFCTEGKALGRKGVGFDSSENESILKGNGRGVKLSKCVVKSCSREKNIERTEGRRTGSGEKWHGGGGGRSRRGDKFLDLQGVFS